MKINEGHGKQLTNLKMQPGGLRLFPHSKKTIQSAKSDSELLNMRITLHVKDNRHVMTKTIGKNQVIESIQ